VGAVRLGDEPPAWTSFVHVDRVERSAEAIAQAGGTLLARRDGALVFADGEGARLGVSTRAAQSADEPVVGHFCWEMLRTADRPAAERFYEQVFAWIAGAGPGEGRTVFNAGMVPVADVVAGPPAWLTFVTVDKLDSARRKAVELGGQLLAAPGESPSFGQVALIADPGGATIGLLEPAS
jgi:predicted enzyme related to lactoylglutathione lyase